MVKDKELFEKLKLLRNHGIKSEDEIVLSGINAKMNEFQAVMGLCNLENIDEKIRLRKMCYEYYKKKLMDIENIKFQKIIASRYNCAYMPICFENSERDSIYLKLIENEIKPRKYFYPLTVKSDYFKEKGVNLIEKYGLMKSFDIASRILCLPLYPELKLEIVDKISELLHDFYKLSV